MLGTRKNKKKRVKTQPAPLNRFSIALDRIRSHKEYRPKRVARAPYGFFLGRPIINEHGPFNGGVYLSAEPYEALVLDDRFGLLKNAYEELLLDFVRQHPAPANKYDERPLLKSIFNYVATKLRYVGPKEYEGIAQAHQLLPDQKIALDVFLELRLGSDRHQVLLAAYLIERAKQRGLMDGAIYLPPRYEPDSKGGESLIYTSITGEIFSFVPRQNPPLC